MATKAKLKRYNGSTWEQYYPETTTDQVVGLATEISDIYTDIGTKVSKSGDTMSGDLRIESGSFASLTLDREGVTGSGSVVLFENNNGTIGGIGAFGDDGLQFRTKDGTEMVIDASNNVGIGTTDPTTKLQVYGEISTNYQSADFNTGGVRTFADMIGSTKLARIGTVSGGSNLTGEEGALGLYTRNSEKVRISVNGDVGIGTTSPSAKLDVNGTIKEAGTALSSKYAAISHTHAISDVTGLQTALDGKATESYVNTQVANLVDSSPTTLDTLNELAAALGDDPNFATTVTNSIAGKANLSHEHNITDINGLIESDDFSGTYSPVFYIGADNRLFTNGGGITFTGSTDTLAVAGNVTVGGTSVSLEGHTHDNRYYTESEADSRFVNANGDVMLGTLTTKAIVMQNQNLSGVNALIFNDPGPNEGISWSGGNFSIYESPDDLTTNASGNLQFVSGGARRLTVGSDGIVDIPGGLTIGNGVTLKESTDRADLLRITSSTSGWGGIQIENSSLETLASFMTDGTSIGIYDDQQNEWAWLYYENSGHTFYHNGSAKLSTTSTGLSLGGQIDMNNNDIVGVDQIIHEGDTNTYMQFHASDQWRVVTGGAERLEVNNSAVTVQNKLVGKINEVNNNVGINFWTGTQAQYNALTPSATTVYFVTG